MKKRLWVYHYYNNSALCIDSVDGKRREVKLQRENPGRVYAAVDEQTMPLEDRSWFEVVDNVSVVLVNYHLTSSEFARAAGRMRRGKICHMDREMLSFVNVNQRFLKMFVVNKTEPADDFFIECALLAKLDTPYGWFDVEIAAGHEIVLKPSNINRADVNDLPPLKILYYDIEVLTERTWPDPSAGDGVTMVSCVSSTEKKLFRTTKHTTEADMLAEFARYVARHDVVVGWNSIAFDNDYLRRRRCPNMFEDRFCMMMGKGTKAHLFDGVINIDLFRYFLNHPYASSAPSLSLDDIANSLEVGGKMDDGKRLLNDKDFARACKLWFAGGRSLSREDEEKYDRLGEYCVRDSELVMLIDQKQNLVKFLITLAFVGCQNPNDVSVRARSFVPIRYCWYNMLLNHAPQPSCYEYFKTSSVGESRKMHLNMSSFVNRNKYEGATVYEPVPGVHRNCCTVDANSLYPSVEIQWNVSPGTSFVHDTNREGPVNGEVFHTHDKLSDGRVIVSSKTDEGPITFILKNLIKIRKEFKRAKENEKQLAVKCITNMIYGLFGNPHNQLSNVSLAAVTTFLGRFVMSDFSEWMRTVGLEIVYGDTDSNVVKIPDDWTRTNVQTAVDQYNARREHITFEIEIFYALFAIRTKKRYIGYTTEPREEIKTSGMDKKVSKRFKDFARNTVMEQMRLFESNGSFDEELFDSRLRSSLDSFKGDFETCKTSATVKDKESYKDTATNPVVRYIRGKGISPKHQSMIEYVYAWKDFATEKSSPLMIEHDGDWFKLVGMKVNPDHMLPIKMKNFFDDILPGRCSRVVEEYKRILNERRLIDANVALDLTNKRKYNLFESIGRVTRFVSHVEKFDEWFDFALKTNVVSKKNRFGESPGGKVVVSDTGRDVFFAGEGLKLVSSSRGLTAGRLVGLETVRTHSIVEICSSLGPTERLRVLLQILQVLTPLEASQRLRKELSPGETILTNVGCFVVSRQRSLIHASCLEECTYLLTTTR